MPKQTMIGCQCTSHGGNETRHNVIGISLYLVGGGYEKTHYDECISYGGNVSTHYSRGHNVHGVDCHIPEPNPTMHE